MGMNPAEIVGVSKEFVITMLLPVLAVAVIQIKLRTEKRKMGIKCWSIFVVFGSVFNYS